MTTKYAIVDVKRCCVMWLHRDLDVLRDLVYIELASDYPTLVLPVIDSNSLEDFTDNQVWKLAISLGIPTAELGEHPRRRVVQVLRDMGETKARLIEVCMQADWIREHTNDALTKYRYVYDDTVPTFASADYLPDAMRAKSLGKGKREFLRSIKFKVFMYLNDLYRERNYPKDLREIRLICRQANAFIVEEFGYKPTTVAQHISEWKKELIANEYKLTRYDREPRNSGKSEEG